MSEIKRDSERLFVCVSMCVCVCEREREREREREKEKGIYGQKHKVFSFSSFML